MSREFGFWLPRKRWLLGESIEAEIVLNAILDVDMTQCHVVANCRCHFWLAFYIECMSISRQYEAYNINWNMA